MCEQKCIQSLVCVSAYVCIFNKDGAIVAGRIHGTQRQFKDVTDDILAATLVVGTMCKSKHLTRKF